MAKAYEVTIQGKYAGQLVINRLSFASDIDDPSVIGAFQLALALGFDPNNVGDPVVDTVLEKFRDAQTALYTVEKLFVRNLESVTDFYQALVAGAGWAGTMTSNGGPSPSFVSGKLVTNRIRTDVRAGTLSLTPPYEGNYDQNGLLNQNVLNLYQDLADYLNAPPSFTSGQITGNYLPAVFKKEEYTPDPLKPEKKAYRYPEDIQVMLTQSAIGVTWQVSDTVTSQTSRRIGKGR